MASKDIPDFMRGFDTTDDWGMVPVSSTPKAEPSVDPKLVENSSLEIAKVKSDVGDIKSMMNEIMQIVAEKDKVTETLESEDVTKRFKEAEKLILPFLYNLMKSEEPYIHWPNRTPIIKAQIEKFLQITRGK